MHGIVDQVRWTSERLDELRTLVHAGKTFRQIAEQLGVSRSAIAGVCNRNGIEHPEPPQIASEKARRKREPKASAMLRLKPPMNWRKAAEFEAADMNDSPARLVAFFDLEPHHCRWPIGDPPEYCGRRKAEESSYCAEHARIAMVRVRRE